MKEDLLKILACPRSRTELKLESQILKNSDGSNSYPMLGDIPWLTIHPQSDITQGARSARAWIYDQQLKNERLNKKLETGKSPNIAKWKNLSRAHQEQSQYLEELFKPLFDLAQLPMNFPPHLLPPATTAKNFSVSFFRDWLWGEKELNSQLDLVKERLGRPKKILFLGSGSCGLPLKIHQMLQPEMSVALDLSPFLTLAAGKILSGQDFKLNHFPNYPKNLDSLSVPFESSGANPKTSQFHLVLGDAQNLPFQEKSFDLVVTLWLIDVIKQPITEFASAINHVLSDGGRWLNLGLLDFRDSHGEVSMTAEDLQKLIPEAGFSQSSWKMSDLDYLNSPYETLRRNDTILSFEFLKQKHQSSPIIFSDQPVWLIDKNLPIPSSPQVNETLLQTEISKFLLSHLDGKISVNQLIYQLENTVKVPGPLAFEMVVNFFSNYSNRLFNG
jgi:uncharacterized protein YbaR (Trm112 family)